MARRGRRARRRRGRGTIRLAVHALAFVTLELLSRIVVRSGPAIRLDLVNGKTLFVTVDDAATGARVLQALLRRESSRAATTSGLTP